MIVPVEIDDCRYNLLMAGSLKLTTEEIASGWHFCPGLDGKLVLPIDVACESATLTTVPCGCEKANLDNLFR